MYNDRAEVAGHGALFVPRCNSQSSIVGKVPSVCGLASRQPPQQRPAAHGGHFAMAKTSTCHPNRKHVSGGLCGPCYRLELAKRNHPGWKNQRCICGCGQVPYPGSKYVKSHVHRKMSPEHRANLSKAGKGRPGNPKAIAAAAAWHRGRPMTEKQRLALLNANLGRSPTPEDRAKKRAAHLGRKPSEMARLAVAEANRQRVWTDEMRQKHWNWKGGKQKGYPVHWHAI
jgi:hypothetical protein